MLFAIPPSMKKIIRKHRYNWRPDLPDQRDYLFLERIAPPKSLPKSVDLRPKCSPVFNQGQIGSCTGNALAGALEFLEMAKIPQEIYDPGKFKNISRLFIYYNERAIEGTTEQDSGGALRDGIKALSKSGACREDLWKYDSSNTFKKPTPAAYKEAKQHCISNYLKINNLQGVKSSLALGFPVAFGFSVYESFEAPDVAKSGIMPIPASDEHLMGGHAVLAVGYDDAKGKLIVRNSWGAQWGMKGYFLMPYEILTELNLARDFWMIQK